MTVPWDISVVAKDNGAELETMAFLKDQGALTEVEFDSWCLEHFSALPGSPPVASQVKVERLAARHI